MGGLKPPGKSQYVVTFLRQHAEIQGIKPADVRHMKKIFLPRGTKKLDVYREFVMSVEETDVVERFSFKYFCHVWKTKCNHIQILQNGSDFCDTCTSIFAKKTLTTEDRQKYDVHRALARKERAYYSQQCHDTTITHITFDYAQSVHVPFFLRQPGSYYFKVGLVVRIFGIHCETTKKQMNYLLPEGCYPADHRRGGKGSNVVISLLHHYLQTYLESNDQKQLKFHADSCGGQNKNKYVFYYMLWRVIMGLNDRLELSFMLPGHTKSAPDAGFGCLKESLEKTMC